MKFFGAVNLLLGTMALFAGLMNALVAGLGATETAIQQIILAIALIVTSICGIHGGTLLFKDGTSAITNHLFGIMLLVFVGMTAVFEQSYTQPRLIALSIYSIALLLSLQTVNASPEAYTPPVPREEDKDVIKEKSP